MIQSKEQDCFILSILSYISIASSGHTFHLDSKVGKTAIRHQTRFYSYLIVEFNIFVAIWKYFATKNSKYVFKIFFLYLFIFLNLARKIICGKKGIMFDLLIFFIRITHLVNIMDRLRISEVCSHCKRFSIEENINQILKLRAGIKILTSLSNMFSVMTFIYIIHRRMFTEFIFNCTLFLLWNFLESYDNDEKILMRIVFLIIYFLNMVCQVILIEKTHSLKE